MTNKLQTPGAPGTTTTGFLPLTITHQPIYSFTHSLFYSKQTQFHQQCIFPQLAQRVTGHARRVTIHAKQTQFHTQRIRNTTYETKTNPISTVALGDSGVIYDKKIQNIPKKYKNSQKNAKNPRSFLHLLS